MTHDEKALWEENSRLKCQYDRFVREHENSLKSQLEPLQSALMDNLRDWEGVRLHHINHLEEPDRQVFWLAVEAIKRTRAVLKNSLTGLKACAGAAVSSTEGRV